MKNNLPVILSILFFVLYQFIMTYFEIGVNYFSIERSLGAGGVIIVGYILGKLIAKKYIKEDK